MEAPKKPLSENPDKDLLLREEVEERGRNENPLSDSEASYRCVVETIGIGISLINPSMEVLALNNRMREWFPHSDVSATPLCYRTIPKPPREDICPSCPAYQTLQDGNIHDSVMEFEVENLRRQYRITSHPMKEHAGNIYAAFQMVEDITEQMRPLEILRTTESKYQAVFDESPVASIIVADNNLIVHANKEFEEMIGYERHALEGKKIWTEFADNDPLETDTAARSLYSAVGESTPPLCETTLATRNSGMMEVRMGAVPIAGTEMRMISFYDMSGLKRVEEHVRRTEQALADQSEKLKEISTAFKVVLQQREDDRKEHETRVLFNIRELVMPYLDQLKTSRLTESQRDCIDVIEKSLNEVVSPFLHNLKGAFFDLTPKEMQIADLIKAGKTTKEIAELINSSTRAIDYHRHNLREKLGLKNTKTDLRTYLLSLS